MNIWHDISKDRIKKDDFVAVIEIPKGCKNKYELDKETGMIVLDRVLYTSTHYPANYGFIPRTYAGDNDPLDVLVLCQERIDPAVLVRVYPIGVIKMIDGGEVDEKIIALPSRIPHIQAIRISVIFPNIFSKKSLISLRFIKSLRIRKLLLRKFWAEKKQKKSSKAVFLNTKRSSATNNTKLKGRKCVLLVLQINFRLFFKRITYKIFSIKVFFIHTNSINPTVVISFIVINSFICITAG